MNTALLLNSNIPSKLPLDAFVQKQLPLYVCMEFHYYCANYLQPQNPDIQNMFKIFFFFLKHCQSFILHLPDAGNPTV